MIERGGGLRLAQEALASLVAVAILELQELQRDRAVELRVDSALYTTPMPPSPSFSRTR